VKVTFALVTTGKQLLLTRPQSWNYELPQMKLDALDTTVECSLSKLWRHLRDMGVKGATLAGKVEVKGATEIDSTLHLLMLVPLAGVALTTALKPIDAGYQLTGFQVMNPWVNLLPSLLEWSL
jgi:hypothetical protein